MEYRSGRIDAGLFPDLDDGEGARNRWPLTGTSARRRQWWCRATFHAHDEDVARLRIERECPRAHHRLEILHHLEARGAVLPDDRERAVAVRAERFHRPGVEHGAVRTAGEREGREDLSIGGPENDHHRLGWLAGGARLGARGKQDPVGHVEREPVAAADIAEGIMRRRLHCLLVYDG